MKNTKMKKLCSIILALCFSWEVVLFFDSLAEASSSSSPYFILQNAARYSN